MMRDVVMTEHGELRVRKRAGLPKKTAEKLASKALTHGLTLSDFSGSFRRYLDCLRFSSLYKPSIRVYNGYIFLFRGNVLITMFHAPPRYRKLATTKKPAQHNKEED